MKDPNAYHIAVVGASELAIVAGDLQTELNRRGYNGRSKPRVVVHNYAVTGSTIEEYWDLSKRDLLLRPWPPITDQKIAKVDMVFLFFGGNDMLLKRDVTLIEKDIEAKIERCRKLGTPVVLVGVRESDLRALSSSVKFPPGYTKACEAMFERLSKRPGVVAFYPSIYKGLEPSDYLAGNMHKWENGKKILGSETLGNGWQLVRHSSSGGRPKEFILEMADISKGRREIHTNPEGQRKLARYYADFLEPLIEKPSWQSRVASRATTTATRAIG